MPQRPVIVRLTPDNLPELVGGCAGCVAWQLTPVDRDRARGHEADEKATWLSLVLREWGSCGRVAYDGPPEDPSSRVIGHVLYAPAVFVPGAQSFATSPVSPDAVVIAGLRVDPDYAGSGVGRSLVQALAKDLIERGGLRAVEAFADTRTGHGHQAPTGRACAGSGPADCVVPAEFLLAVGFRTARAHARHPRMRMDLRSLVTWRAELEDALERLRGVVRPKPVPKPSRSATRGSARVGETVGSARRAPARPWPRGARSRVLRWLSR